MAFIVTVIQCIYKMLQISMDVIRHFRHLLDVVMSTARDGRRLMTTT